MYFPIRSPFAVLVLLLFSAIASAPAREAPPAACEIRVVEKGTGWPVPLVELETNHHVRFVTDNAGRVAFDAVELFGQETWLTVRGNGYSVPGDGFGYRGVRVTPTAGGSLQIEVTRDIIAQRIGRMTGAGRFAESQKLGYELDWKDSEVLGCDTVQTAVHQNRLFWAYGDTTLAHYPLGVFNGTGGFTINLKVDMEPPLKFRLQYVVDEKGRPRGICPMPGEGPTWITGPVSLRDASGTDRLVCAYVKVKDYLDVYRWGFAEWDPAKEQFQPKSVVWEKSEKSPKPNRNPEGHAVRWKDPAGKEWVLFGNPFPAMRVAARYEDWADFSKWEMLDPQPELKGAGGQRKVIPHSGSIAWCEFRQKWVTVFEEKNGKPSEFGELWYAESNSPTGPWGTAVKVLSHENYTFYNPKIHIEFSKDDSPYLYFEGTYTAEFARRPQVTPRYDYNQMLYRVDLRDERLRAAKE